MVDSATKAPDGISQDKWENFEEEEAFVSNEISVRRAEHNERLPEDSELITGERTIKQLGNSSPKVNGLKRTPSWENLDEISVDTHSSTGDGTQSLRPFDRGSCSAVVYDFQDTDHLTNIGSAGETTSTAKGKENVEEKIIQSSELSRGETDGSGSNLNGTHDATSSRSCDGNSANNLDWTSFEEGRDKDLSTEATNIRNAQELRIVGTENSTPVNQKMAAFDSSATAKIIPNLVMATEPGGAEMISVTLSQVSSTCNGSMAVLNEKISSGSTNAANNMVSAVQSAKIASSNKAEGHNPVVNNVGKKNDLTLGNNWVRFGEDGKEQTIVEQDGHMVLSESSSNGKTVNAGDTNVETSQTPVAQSIQTLVVDYKVKTTNDISLQAGETIKTREESNIITTSASSSVTLTAADLDLLAQNSWMQFADSVKGQKQRTLSAAKETDSPKQSPNSWVTFGEPAPRTDQSLNVCVLDVGVKNEPSSSTSSPNPFNPPQGVNPFKPPLNVVTNPFKPEDITTGDLASKVSPLASQSPVLTSTPLVEKAVPALVSKGSTTPEVLLEHGTAPTHETAPEQVDAGLNALLEVEKEVVIDSEPLFEEKASSTPSGSWSMLLRFPDKKRKIGSRVWKSVVIKLEGTTLQIYEEYELSAPFREIPLQAYFAFTSPKLQSFERGAKVHTVKLEYVKYTESRSLRHRGIIEHIAEGTPIIKVASPSHTAIRELLESVNNSIRLLPAYRDRGITYRHDEVFVDIDDVSDILLAGDGTVLRKNARVLVKVRAFLTGDPECQLVLNDVCVREREEARLRGELKPQRVHHWVKLRHCDFHKCVNVANFEQSHAITFHPLDACTFELMRFQVDHHKPLPLLIKVALNIHNEQRVELRAEIQVCQETKMVKYTRSNVVFRFPIPESWVPLFRTGRMLRGETSIKSSRGRRAAGIKSRLKHSKCSIGVTLGKAMYEPEYGSIVWRIDQLPFIHSKVPVDTPQMLTCSLDLPPGMEYPENYKPTAELEYDVAYVLVSDTNVIAVKVSNQNIPDKWVCYRAFYHYDINIDISKPSSGPVRDVGCVQQ